MTGSVLVIHGGAGTILKGEVAAERETAIRTALHAALAAGRAILDAGGPALDAVEAAVRVMEDSACFNAGHGAALTSEGTIEHDAAIMDGRTRAAGAISGSRRIRNPVSAARAVMERTPHVMLTGEGAERFARNEGLPLAQEWYFFTRERLEALERVQRARASRQAISEREKHGTVGAVACDAAGHVAAATSTGGYADKMPGRVGDSPIIGAGTYADNASCAVSATGDGEYFIRVSVARMICARVQMQGMTAEAAARATLDEVKALGGTGGVIVLGHKGDVALSMNTEGMFRGRADSTGRKEVAIYTDE